MIRFDCPSRVLSPLSSLCLSIFFLFIQSFILPAMIVGFPCMVWITLKCIVQLSTDNCTEPSLPSSDFVHVLFFGKSEQERSLRVTTMHVHTLHCLLTFPSSSFFQSNFLHFLTSFSFSNVWWRPGRFGPRRMFGPSLWSCRMQHTCSWRRSLVSQNVNNDVLDADTNVYIYQTVQYWKTFRRDQSCPVCID